MGAATGEVKSLGCAKRKGRIVKRSGGVTAAAIVLFLGSALLILFMGLSCLLLVFPQPGDVNPTQQYQAFIFGIGFYGVFAAWGVVTAVGILRLRNWARISILVMAGFAISCLLLAIVSLFLIGPMMSQMPGMNAGIEKVMLGIFIVMFAIPIGISIWWLVLFMRRSVRTQFESDLLGASRNVPLMPAAETAPRAQTLIRDPRRIPASLIVIAIFLLLGSAFVGMTILFVVPTHSPLLLLGILLNWKESVTVTGLTGIVELALGIALLKKKPWSLDAAIAFVIFGIFNALLFIVSPSRDAYLNFFLQHEQSTPNLPPDFIPRMMHAFMPLIMGFSVAVSLVALYFLWTRRKAYRAACAVR